MGWGVGSRAGGGGIAGAARRRAVRVPPPGKARYARGPGHPVRRDSVGPEARQWAAFGDGHLRTARAEGTQGAATTLTLGLPGPAIAEARPTGDAAGAFVCPGRASLALRHRPPPLQRGGTWERCGKGGRGSCRDIRRGSSGGGGGSRLGSEGVAAEVLREAAEQLDRQKQVTLKDISVSDKGGGDGDSGGFNSLKKRGSNGEMDGGGSISPEIQRLRERMGGIGDSMPVGPSRAPPAGAAARRPLFTEGQGPGRAVRDGRESQTGALRSGSGRSFFQKLKQVAQQPALAGPPRSSIPLLEIGGAAAGGGGGDWGSSSTPSSQRTTPKAAEDPKGAGGIVRGGTARPGGSGGKGPSKGRKAD